MKLQGIEGNNITVLKPLLQAIFWCRDTLNYVILDTQILRTNSLNTLKIKDQHEICGFLWQMFKTIEVDLFVTDILFLN